MNNTEIGKLRPSQLLQYYGPGAIVDLLEDSVVITPADKWYIPRENRYHETRLERMLNIDYIRLVSEGEDRIKVGAKPFPKWRICPSCGMMDMYASRKCYYCYKNEEKEVKLFPARFILVCEKGHLSDFPWIDWVHKGKTCSSGKPVLKYKSKGSAGSLSDIKIKCVKCGEENNLANIFKESELEKYVPSCNGNRPWIGDSESCDGKMVTSLRAASNVYTPLITSVLSIPLSSSQEDDLMFLVDSKREIISNLLNSMNFDENMKKMVICSALGRDESDYEKIMSYYVNEQMVTYDSIRKQEWSTLTIGNVNDQETTGFISKDVMVHDDLKPYFKKITRVDRLREVRVLHGFTRLQYPDPFFEEDIQAISIMERKQPWLPGALVHGEGVFFEFNPNKINGWQSNQTIQEQLQNIILKYNRKREELGYSSRDLSSKDILIHSFSHMLMKEFAAHSGYSTTSLRERLYCGPGMMGVLIYTASSDSEGSLGGLIELTKPEKLYPIFVRALERMEHCSSDPHCSDGDFDLQTSVNGAACHACLYVSETSCEWNNQLLDRRTLVSLLGFEELPFFNV
ncbi:DUF1998 domain-containing protein [Bacillus sp. AGMB 02131]|uniref:DUF1998 domain-containing protein n=1 Tax=Peribacillus faecalis TaxID=2772559 RepID=A0A927CU92_9BACI|nr:DUF1998 domain-containing protein [Peribacillus faecalis]MBD3107927.1 DUF1998 domain-containing protein [Peribacillus faecalis]